MMSAGLSVGEVTLREIDFAFPAQLRQVTLRDEDSLTEKVITTPPVASGSASSVATCYE
jgi:hypothetical protein